MRFDKQIISVMLFAVFFLIALPVSAEDDFEYMIEDINFVGDWRVNNQNNQGSISGNEDYTIAELEPEPGSILARTTFSKPFSGEAGAFISLNMEIRCESYSHASARFYVSSDGISGTGETLTCDDSGEWRRLTIEDFQIPSDGKFSMNIYLNHDRSAGTSILYLRHLSSDTRLSAVSMRNNCEGCDSDSDCRYGYCSSFSDGSDRCVPWDAGFMYECTVTKESDDGGGGCFIETCFK